jgi:hypothetical protein
MNNQIIGISLFFAIAVLLLVFRQWFLAIGRTNRNRNFGTTQSPAQFESNSKIQDDPWLLWSPLNESDSGAGSETRQPVTWDAGHRTHRRNRRHEAGARR